MFKGITKRWILSTMLVIFVIFSLIVTSLIFAVISLYNQDVEQRLSSVSNEISAVFEGYQAENSTVFFSGAKDYVEDFAHKESMEVMVINSAGRVVLTSTGFSYDDNDKFQDFSEASKSQEKTAFWDGVLSSGEKVKSFTRIVTNTEGSVIGAVRYVVSMTDVNNRIILISAVLILAGIVILSLITLSGNMFIRSIVTPVRELRDTAEKIAHGDFSTKIQKHRNDEIGELTEAITDMAKDLEATEQMKNDFISRVSHELRTPLTAIKGWAETMQLSGKGKLDRKTFDKGMGVIIKESTRLTGLVEELLDFSRIQTGRMVLLNEKLDILAELDETVYMLKDRAVNEGKHLIYDEPEAVFPPVYGDRNRLKQVFINIIDNALKYTPENGVVAIEIKYNPEEENIAIIVTDTGCGISAEDLPKVKEKFYKANQTVRGSGIGLAVADEIVQLHKGSLDIESGVGVGTTVTITIPVMSDSDK